MSMVWRFLKCFIKAFILLIALCVLLINLICGTIYLVAKFPIEFILIVFFGFVFALTIVFYKGK